VGDGAVGDSEVRLLFELDTTGVTLTAGTLALMVPEAGEGTLEAGVAVRFVELNSIAVELDAATLTRLPEYCAPTVELELIIVTLRAVTLVTLLLLLRPCETMVVLDPKGVIVLDAVTFTTLPVILDLCAPTLE